MIQIISIGWNCTAGTETVHSSQKHPLSIYLVSYIISSLIDATHLLSMDLNLGRYFKRIYIQEWQKWIAIHTEFYIIHDRIIW